MSELNKQWCFGCKKAVYALLFAPYCFPTQCPWCRETFIGLTERPTDNKQRVPEAPKSFYRGSQWTEQQTFEQRMTEQDGRFLSGMKISWQN